MSGRYRPVDTLPSYHTNGRGANGTSTPNRQQQQQQQQQQASSAWLDANPAAAGPGPGSVSYAYAAANSPRATAAKLKSYFVTSPGAGLANGAAEHDGDQSLEEQFHFSTQLRRTSTNHGDHHGTSYPPSVEPSNPKGFSASAACCHLPVSEVQQRYHLPSLAEGLPTAQVAGARMRAGGYNEFSVQDQEPAWQKFLDQFKEPLIALLLGSAVVSALMGEWDDAISIALAVLVVITVGFVQERRSEKSLEALNKLVPHYCHLIRDGQQTTVLANELVPGDVVTFSTGDRIPADVRIFEAVQLEVDESTLTGEIKPLHKHADVVPRPEPANGVTFNGSSQSQGDNDDVGAHAKGQTSINERENIAFMGTLVRNGYGKGIVVATGSQTEFGMIFSMVDEAGERRTPLQLSMDELAAKLSAISFAIIGVICLLGVIQHKGWLEMFTIGVSLAVAAIPEGLPIVVTVTLALGVLRMSRRKAIVKRLPSVETLGCVSVICSDKTGTLTCNQMTVVSIFTLEDGVIDLSSVAAGGGAIHSTPLPHHQSPALARCLLAGNLCNNSHRAENGENMGQATDVAMVNVLRLFGLEDKRPYFKRTREVPFSSDNKHMAVQGSLSAPGPGSAVATGDEALYVKGALEVLLEKCNAYVGPEGTRVALDDATRRKITSAADQMASKGLRVLLTAVGSSTSLESSTLSFCGLQAMQDPPRPGVKEAIAALERGKVQVVMITGDAESTACAIARQLGILKSYHPTTTTANGSGVMAAGVVSPAVMTGRQLDSLSERQLQERIGSICVFARTTPRHKMAIVRAFQANGEVVAMSGDGVNDAPALKMADIGISMGKGGTDVAKEAADVILVDDNFATILPAVEEGKGIFNNIQNFLAFQLSTAVAALTLITLSTALGLKPPLNPMQILFINIIMDGPPSQSLGVDPVDRSVMRRPPRPKSAPIVTKRLIQRCLFSASIIVLGTLWVYVHMLDEAGAADQRDQTMTFTCFVLLDLVSALQNRGLTTALGGNRMLILTVSGSVLTLLALLSVPPLQGVFQTTTLGLSDAFTLLCLAGLSFGLHEARRRYERRLDATRGEEWEDSVV